MELKQRDQIIFCLAGEKVATFSTVYTLCVRDDSSSTIHQRDLFISVLRVIYLKSARTFHSTFPCMSTLSRYNHEPEFSKVIKFDIKK